MKKQFERKQLLALVIALASSVLLTAQDYSVTPLSNFLENYTEKYTVISEKIESDKNVSFTKKLALYEKEVAKLKESFRKDRISEYRLKSVKRARRSTCKGTRIRGVTDCKSVQMDAPNNKMYTTEEWVKVEKEGAEKDIKVFVDSSFVSINISATSTRTNKASAYTIFKYKPHLIPIIVDKEIEELFSQIVVEVTEKE